MSIISGIPNWANARLAMRCAEVRYLVWKWFFLDIHVVKVAAQKSRIQFSIQSTGNTTHRINLLEKKKVLLYTMLWNRTLTVTYGDCIGTDAVLNILSFAYILQFCMLTNLWSWKWALSVHKTFHGYSLFTFTRAKNSRANDSFLGISTGSNSWTCVILYA